jgi:hypothetical protein
MSLPDMTPAQLLAGATEIMQRAPDAVLVKNAVGNLQVCRGDEYIGYLDCRYGTVDWLDEPWPRDRLPG